MNSPIELVMVTENNNNKYVTMTDLDNGYFKSTWGRVGGHSDSIEYPISKWDSYRNSKIKKGYRDVSDLKIESKSGEYSFKGKGVDHFFNTFSKYTRDNVGKNYTIAVGSVTKAMLDEAQGILNHLIGLTDVEKFNKYLLELYTVLPRRMRNVKDYLVLNDKDLDRLIAKEQDILDSLSSSVVTNVVESGQVFEDSFGIEMEEVDCPQSIRDLVSKTSPSHLSIYKCFKVVHYATQSKFETWLETHPHKQVEYLFHGTRNPNCFSILKSGLLIRPTNTVAISGAVYGIGIYFSDSISKSVNYTGYDNDKLFFVQSVNTGNKAEYNGWYREGKGLSNSQMNYPYLSSQGYSSLHVKAGDGLLRDEYIIYNQEQCCHSFILWMR